MSGARPTRVATTLALAGVLTVVAVALASSQAQARAEEETRFNMRADIAAQFTTTWTVQLLARERTAATDELAAATPDEKAFQSTNDAFGFQAAMLLDAGGRALEVEPSRPDLVGRNLTAQYPYLASALRGTPTVSNLALSAAAGVPVVAFATPFDTEAGRRVYSGAYELDSTPLANYLANAIPMPQHRAYLLDAHGAVLTTSRAHTPHVVHMLSGVDAPLATALRAAPQGLLSSGGTSAYYVSRAVPATPWRIAVTEPTAILYAPVNGAFSWTTWTVHGVLCVAAVATLMLFFRYIAGREQLTALNRELERVSRIDSLTGVHNRRHLDEQLAALLSAGRRHRRPTAVLLIDIDDFKKINDAAGHRGGDCALQEVASRLRRGSRDEDVVGRWGGDEFMIVMAGTDAIAARKAAQRLSRVVSSAPIDTCGLLTPVSLSVGVAAGTDLAPDELRHRADLALYAAKHAGRGRVISVGNEPRTRPVAKTPARASALHQT